MSGKQYEGANQRCACGFNWTCVHSSEATCPRMRELERLERLFQAELFQKKGLACDPDNHGKSGAV